MTDQRTTAPLPRPDAGAAAGPLDDALYDLVEARFVRLIRDNPVLATSLGIHQDDDLLGDGSRDAVLGELDDEREHLAAVEAIDPAGALARSPHRARARDPQRPPLDLRHR